MDFENMYFHGLAGNIVVINQDKLVIDTSLTQLESIIKLGGIMSRSKLKENGVVYSWKPVYNGEDCISVCVKNPLEEEFMDENEGFESAYVPYVQRDRISIIIDESINEHCEFREVKGNCLPGERQVKDKIDSSFFVGIGVMFENEESQMEAVSRIRNLLQEYNVDLPIVDKNFSLIEEESIKL